MLLGQKMGRGGDFLFRWRSYVLLIFVPFIVLSFPEGEIIEHMVGEPYEDIYEVFCLIFAAGGLVLRGYTVGFVPGGTSGRNTKSQIAETLNTTGIYSQTRNPLYLANCITYLGIFLFTQNLLLSFAALLFLIIYYERIIMAEETFLTERFGEMYTTWASQVPVFFPKFSDWQEPAMPFSMKTVLRREYSGWFAAVFALFAIETGREILGEENGWLEPGWLAALIVAAIVYLVLRTLKKKTHLLDVSGR